MSQAAALEDAGTLPPEVVDQLQNTPDLWRALPESVQVTLLLLFLPGVFAHDLTHWLVARALGADAWVLWDRIDVVMRWSPETGRPDHVVAAHAAPFAIGWAVGVIGLAALVIAGPVDVLWTVGAYAVAQWAAYTLPGALDVVEVVRRVSK
jgi:hypothetical protein